MLLGNETRHNVKSDYSCEDVPTTAITLGIANLLSADRVITMAWGENRAAIVKKTVETLTKRQHTRIIPARGIPTPKSWSTSLRPKTSRAYRSHGK